MINIFVLGLHLLLEEALLIICGALANFLESFLSRSAILFPRQKFEKDLARLVIAISRPEASDVALSIGGEIDGDLFKWLFFSDGHALTFVASESNRHAKRNRLHTAATFGTANLTDGDRDTSAGHVRNQLIFVMDGALGEDYYDIALRDINNWASAVDVLDGLKVSDRPIE